MVCIRLLAGRLESYPERYEMIRKWIAGPLLALLAALCLPPAPALAAEQPPDAAETAVSVWSPKEAGADSQELFAAYVMQQFYGSSAKAARDPEGDRLTGLDQKLYDALKGLLMDAAASGGSTDFTIPLSRLVPKTSWTAEDLDGRPVLEEGGVSPQAAAAVNGVAGFNAGEVFQSLLADLGPGLYWLDRSAPIAYAVPALRAVPETEEAPASVLMEGDFHFTFSAAPEYRGEDAAAVREDVSAVGTAVRNAQAIAAAHRDESDHQKLLSFQEELRALAGPGGRAEPGGAFGDPWQMVRALDGDPGTDASGEGWAKAFQYLCGLSGLQDAKCYTVSGLMQENDSIPTPHMWNIVRIGGESYLADLAASLDGGPGRDGGLFLAGAGVYRATNPAGYQVLLPSGSVLYWYENGELDLLGQEVLSLAETDYSPNAGGADGRPEEIRLAAGAVKSAACLLAAFYSGNPRFLEAALRSYPAPAAVLLQT